MDRSPVHDRDFVFPIAKKKKNKLHGGKTGTKVSGTKVRGSLKINIICGTKVRKSSTRVCVDNTSQNGNLTPQILEYCFDIPTWKIFLIFARKTREKTQIWEKHEIVRSGSLQLGR